MDLAVLGIDVGKFEFHCALSVKDQVHTNHFPPFRSGFRKIASLAFKPSCQSGACVYGIDRWLERGARYGSARARSCREHRECAGDQVLGQSELSRTKTDKADAALIARDSSPRPLTCEIDVP